MGKAVVLLAVVCVLLAGLNVRTAQLNRDILAVNSELLEEIEICDGFVVTYRRILRDMLEATHGAE